MKKFILKSLIFFIPFLFIFTAYYIVSHNTSGDLGVLGKIPFGHKYSKEILAQSGLNEDLTKYATDAKEIKDINKKHTILSIGDSFSRLGIGGYQNYLSHTLGCEVINVSDIGTNPLEIAIAMLNADIIDTTYVKTVIIELVDRDLGYRIDNINFDKQLSEVKFYVQNSVEKEVSLNMYDMFSFIRLRFNYQNAVNKYNLNDIYFTHPFYGDKLYCYMEDVKNIYPYLLKKEISENLNKLNNMFIKKGIKMIFLIAADKYDVYRPFFKNNEHKIDTTSEIIIQMENLHDICIIDSKPLLIELIKNNEKDVYMLNDSHWSYKASEAVAKELISKIKSN